MCIPPGHATDGVSRFKLIVLKRDARVCENHSSECNHPINEQSSFAGGGASGAKRQRSSWSSPARVSEGGELPRSSTDETSETSN